MTRQYTLPLPQSEARTVEDFLPSVANAQAVRLVLQTPPSAWPSHLLVLCGPEGCGKSHVASIWRAQHQAQSVVLSDELLASIVEGTCAAKALCLEDADRCQDDLMAQEWLQHFYNATKTAAIPVLLTARKPPAQWGLAIKDIETRLKSCACAVIEEPDDDLVPSLLLKLFRDRQLMVEAGVVQYLATRIERTGAAILRLVCQLDEAALETGHKISVPFVQKVLAKHQPEAEDNHDQDS